MSFLSGPSTLRTGVRQMIWQAQSILTRAIVAAALASFALITTLGPRAAAQTVAAPAQATNTKGADAVPLDLSKFVLMKADNFAKSTQHPWPAVPRGTQTFVGVPVEIQGA